MARRVRSDDDATTAVPSVWREMKASLEASAARQEGIHLDWYDRPPDTRAANLVCEMVARRPVIVSGLMLGPHRPERRTGVHHFRVYPSGRIVPVVPSRDTGNAASIGGWDEVPDR